MAGSLCVSALARPRQGKIHPSGMCEFSVPRVNGAVWCPR